MARVAVMQVRVEGPDLQVNENPRAFDARNQEVNDSIDWSEIEEMISVMLPEGYYCKVEN